MTAELEKDEIHKVQRAAEAAGVSRTTVKRVRDELVTTRSRKETFYLMDRDKRKRKRFGELHRDDDFTKDTHIDHQKLTIPPDLPVGVSAHAFSAQRKVIEIGIRCH